MLPLKSFYLFEPRDVFELKDELGRANLNTRIMAGGTDLLPNMKHGLYEIDRIISLRKITAFKNITAFPKHLRLGALTTLNEISCHPEINKQIPALRKASLHIASPQIRNMGTVGGNICLDTRCLYFNQTEHWRKSLGYCLKKDGCACHVVKTGKRCVAAASNDLATVLLALTAKLSLLDCQEESFCHLEDFYTNDGEKNNKLKPGQIVTSVEVDISTKKYTGFYKLRHRQSIDFPLLSVATAFSLDDENRFCNGRLVINALVAKPRVMDLVEFKGVSYNKNLIDRVASFAEKKCHPQTNICDDLWRARMVAYSVREAFLDAFYCLD